MQDTITLKEFTVELHIGCHDEERVEKQPLIVDLTLYTDLSTSGESDKLEDTIDYVVVCDVVHKVAENEFHTIEAFATQVCAAVKTVCSPDKVHILVRKPNALANRGVKYTCVEMMR